MPNQPSRVNLLDLGRYDNQNGDSCHTRAESVNRFLVDPGLTAVRDPRGAPRTNFFVVLSLREALLSFSAGSNIELN